MGPRWVLVRLIGRLPFVDFTSTRRRPFDPTSKDETLSLPAFVTNRHCLPSPSELSSTEPALSTNGMPSGGFAAGWPLPPVGTCPADPSVPSALRWNTDTKFGTVFVWVKTAPGVKLPA